MAVVGNAYVVVHAITTGFEKEVQDAVSKLKPQISGLGNDLGKSLSRGSTPALKGFAAEAVAARKALNRMIEVGYAVGPAIAGAVSAISDLVFGLGAMVAAVGSAAPALAVLASGFSAVAQAGLTAKLAFSGIGKAVQALNKQQSAAKKNDNGVRDARIALTEAYQRAGNAMADANDKVRNAQLALNQAYKDGAESLQQLGFNAEDAALAQSKAAIELERARETLMRSQDLSPDSRARREAELAFKEAELNYRKTTDQVNDLRKQQEYAAKTGIEGTKEVLDAKNNLLEAEKDRNQQEVENAQSIARAQRALADAIASAKQGVAGLADAFKDMSPEAIAFAKFLVSIKPKINDLKAAAGKNLFGPLTEAIQTLIDKLFPVLIPILEATGGIIGTFAKNFANMLTKPKNLAIFERVFGEKNLIILENFGEIIINLAEAALNLLDAVAPLAVTFSEFLVGMSKDAKNADLTDTFKGAADAIASAKQGVAGLADAFKDMSPEAIAFAKFLVSIKPKINDLKAAAGKNLFGPLTEAIQTLIDKLFPVLIPILEATGGIIGTFAKNFANMLTKPKNLAIFERVFGEKNLIILENFGEIIINLAEAALNLLDAVAPLAVTFSEFLVGMSKDAKNADLTDTFKGAADAAKIIGHALKGLFDGFKAFGKAAAPVGLELIKSLGDAGRSMADFFSPKTKSGQDKMSSKFSQIGENVKAIGGFLGDVLKMLWDLAGNKGVEDFFKAIKPIPGIFANMGTTLAGSGSVIGEFLTTLVEVLAAFVDTGGLELFFKILTEVLNVMKFILELPFVGQLITLFALFKGGTLAIGRTAKVLKFFTGGLIVGPFKMFGDGIIKIGNGIMNFGTKWGKFKGWLSEIRIALFVIKEAIVKGFATVFKFISNIFGKIIGVIGKFVRVFVGALRTIATAAMANPVLAIILLIVGALILAYMKSETFRNIVNAAFEKIKEVVSGVVTWLTEAVPKVFQFIKDAFLKFTLLGIIISHWDQIKEKVSGAVTWFKEAIPKVFEFIKEKFLKFTLLGVIISNWDKIIEFIKGLPAKIASAASGMWDGLKNAFKNAINWLITKWNDFKLEIKIPSTFVTDKLGWSGKGVTLDTPNIPLLAQGGTVYPRAGGVNAILAEAGRPERVEPLDPNGLSARDKAMIEMMSGSRGNGSNPTFNIYPSQGMDELALAHNVSRNVAWSMRRGI